MIDASSLTIEIGQRTLVTDAAFTIGAGEKVGLVGQNGVGKSTLVAVLGGHAGPAVRSSGAVRIEGAVGYLPQAPAAEGLGRDPTGWSHVLSARGLDTLDVELTAARVALGDDPSDERVARFSELEERYRLRGGYEADAVMARLADGVGLPQDLLFEPLASLSGGQRRRVDLIRMLFGAPDVMILDEPTNHLDLAAKRWLIGELAQRPGTMLVISHDLKLLDRSITKVLHLSAAGLREYKGNYTAFRTQSAADRAQRERARTLEDKEIKRLQTLADSMRGQTETRARTARALDSRALRLQGRRTAVDQRERTAVFRLPAPRRSASTPIEVRAVSIRYDGPPVLRRADWALGRGDRLVVIGRNGAGKSSLLRCLAGVQEPTAGAVAIGVNTTVGYFAQEHEQIDPSCSVLDNIDDVALKTEAERRALLGSFGLSGAAAQQRPGSLSGGERAKLGLAMLAAGRANLLVLDEPTNNLDPGSVESVGRMLAVWPGTIVAVSHDRAFVEALAPTHAFRLPDERFDLWREEDLDQVEAR